MGNTNNTTANYKENQLQTGGVLLACNGLTTLKQAKVKYPLDPNTAHYNLIGVIRTICKELPIQIKFEHIKGYQDSRQITALTCLVTIDMEMDTAAKQTIDMVANRPKQYQLRHEPWVCYMGGDRLVTKIAPKLCEEINKITIKAHWDKKIRYKQGHCSMIDFEMARRALHSLPKAQQWWATKMAAHFLPYGMNMKR